VLERPPARGEGLHQQDPRLRGLFVEEDEQRRGRRAQAVARVLLAVELLDAHPRFRGGRSGCWPLDLKPRSIHFR
jgi:hypothetical protein